MWGIVCFIHILLYLCVMVPPGTRGRSRDFYWTVSYYFMIVSPVREVCFLLNSVSCMFSLCEFRVLVFVVFGLKKFCIVTFSIIQVKYFSFSQDADSWSGSFSAHWFNLPHKNSKT